MTEGIEPRADDEAALSTARSWCSNRRPASHQRLTRHRIGFGRNADAARLVDSDGI